MHAGGGTVNFVLPDKYGFVQDVEHREAAGTPNITGIIRTGSHPHLPAYSQYHPMTAIIVQAPELLVVMKFVLR